MSSTFWFLLEFTVLLALAAGAFAWLGWMWRGAAGSDRVVKLQEELETQRRLARAAMDERDAARAEAGSGSVHVSEAAPLIQANEVLENENNRLRDDLNAARAESARLLSQSSASIAESLQKQQQFEGELITLRQHLADAKVAHQSEAATLEQKLSDAEQARLALAAQIAESAAAAENAVREAQTAQSELRAARAEIAALHQQISAAASSSEKTASQFENDLQAARGEIRTLQQQLVATEITKTELEAARGEIRTLQQQLAATEPTKTEVEAARSEIRRLQQQLAAAELKPHVVPTPVIPAVPAPTVIAPKPRATSRKPKAPATHSAQEKLAQIETALAPQLAVLAALTQERDDWQRRVTTLESKTPPDLAGLGLARRSLASSAERLSEAQAAVESLQNQQRALHKALQQAAELAGVADDDLTKIKGIKGVLSEQLHAHGIRTWRQIAGWNEDDLRAFSELLAFKNRAARDHWQEQARLLAQQ